MKTLHYNVSTDFQAAVKTACKHYHDSERLGGLTLAERALQAALATNPLHPTDYHGRALALQQAITASLEKMSVHKPSTRAGEAYWCVFMFTHRRDPYHDNVRINSINAYAEAGGGRAPLTYQNRLREGLAMLSYHLNLYLAQRGVPMAPVSIEPPPFVSPKEHVVLTLAAAGKTATKELACQLAVRASTIETYWKRIRTKLGARNRTEALILARRAGLIQ